ncbi:MAG: hypothetical protein HQK53_11155 [Oligoflexia bacterium]|nr:hypothetical protein [Oligoflexia bacterium]
MKLKKELNVSSWVTAFSGNKSFWGQSVHVDEFLSKGKSSEYYFDQAINLFKELVLQTKKLGLNTKYIPRLYIYLKQSECFTSEINTSDVRSILETTPPELYLVDRPPVFENGTSEYYEKPLEIDNLWVVETELNSDGEIYCYYVCWKPLDDDNYNRFIIIECRSK